jgi:hypothetical protein
MNNPPTAYTENLTGSKRPKAATRRFTAPFPNAMWQLESFDYCLADGTVVVVIQVGACPVFCVSGRSVVHR